MIAKALRNTVILSLSLSVASALAAVTLGSKPLGVWAVLFAVAGLVMTLVMVGFDFTKSGDE